MRCVDILTCRICCSKAEKAKSPLKESREDELNGNEMISHSLMLLQYLEESSDEDEENDSEVPIQDSSSIDGSQGCRKRIVTIDVNRDLTARHFRREMNREQETNEAKVKFV